MFGMTKNVVEALLENGSRAWGSFLDVYGKTLRSAISISVTADENILQTIVECIKARLLVDECREIRQYVGRQPCQESEIKNWLARVAEEESLKFTVDLFGRALRHEAGAKDRVRELAHPTIRKVLNKYTQSKVKHDLEDIEQEIYMALFEEKIQNFLDSVKKGGKRNHFRAWLTLVAHNTVLDHLRILGTQDRKRKVSPSSDFVDSIGDPSKSPEDILSDGEQKERMQKFIEMVLKALPPLDEGCQLLLRNLYYSRDGKVPMREAAAVSGLEDEQKGYYLLRKNYQHLRKILAEKGVTGGQYRALCRGE